MFTLRLPYCCFLTVVCYCLGYVLGKKGIRCDVLEEELYMEMKVKMEGIADKTNHRRGARERKEKLVQTLQHSRVSILISFHFIQCKHNTTPSPSQAMQFNCL
jgi:hypothetical protein